MAVQFVPLKAAIVQVGSPKRETRWQDASGRWWTPGEVTPDGVIVGSPGQFISAGVVWIDATMQLSAAQHRWMPNGVKSGDGALIQVERP